MIEINLTIGEKIRDIRKANKLKQKEMAKILNITDSTLSLYENDKLIPNLYVIRELVNIFGISYEKLLNETHW